MIHTGKIMVGISLILLSIAMMVSPSAAVGQAGNDCTFTVTAHMTGDDALHGKGTGSTGGNCPPPVPMPHTRTNV